MKKAVTLLLFLSMLPVLMGCGTKNTDQLPGMTESEAAQEATAETSSSNILVAYFSRTGNTKLLAEYAVELLNADSFEIEAALPYSDADIAYYTNCRADREQADPAARPEIANHVPNMQRYDLILLGYPIWHGQAPRIISTFLESYDFSGITILPFCTSQSSPIGTSDRDLRSLCSAQWKDGKRFAASGDEQKFSEWLSQNTVRNEDAAMAKELTLTADGTVLPVLWEKNPSVAELIKYASMEPIQISMRMYGGWEQVGSLPRPIVRKDVQTTAGNGDIMLYSGNQIVLFYGENTWAYTKLGHIDLPEEEVTALLSSGAIQITLAAQ